MEIIVQNKRLIEALEKSPEVLKKRMGLAIGRAVREVARDARRNAPKAHSTLVNSIRPRQPSPLTGEVVAGVDYARMVEEGTGPGGSPPVRSIMDWLRVRRITPNDPTMHLWDLAYLIRRSILNKGTPAQPYLRPALESNRTRIQRKLDRAVSLALQDLRVVRIPFPDSGGR